MDLWILSQEKDLLIKVNHICYRCVYDSKNRQLHIITNDDYDFGLYKTKQRALEVIGEIQKLLMNDVDLFKNFDISPNDLESFAIDNACVYSSKDGNTQIEHIKRNCVVFEMPEK